MATLIVKFGGAALEKIEGFSRMARIIESGKKYYRNIVVVTSAMKGETDRLLALASSVNSHPPGREVDMLISAGERITSPLLAMALIEKGVPAVSFTGSQSGIITTNDHTDAKIVHIKPFRIKKALEAGFIPVIAGFQGVSLEGEITTLGRGGSDTSAVALGVALGAEKVEFFKDVDGIYSEDPNRVKDALHYPYLSYDRALDIVEKGAKILHARALRLAKKNGMFLIVTSFTGEGKRTEIGFSERTEQTSGTPLYEMENSEIM